ncbi:DUF664 domain-containing protein, partial [Micromonospora sp. NPDC005171]|uniref:mycothiol transferase n=1 Tax=Micromonospora sp. NPDC005171 TaxID=3156866 RepID=UPI0033B8B69E
FFPMLSMMMDILPETPGPLISDVRQNGAGPDEKSLRSTTAASAMTLGGLVKHVALVEADWLAVKLAGQEYGAPWDGVDFGADPDWEWRTGALDSPEDVYTVWRDAVERSRARG